MHSEKFDLVNKYYKTRLWNEQRVRNAVVQGWITKDEFQEITGSSYEE